VTASFVAELESTAKDILAAVESGKARTAWELKMLLKVPHTRLHLSLGMLLARGQVSVRPDRLTFVVERARTGQPQ